MNRPENVFSIDVIDNIGYQISMIKNDIIDKYISIKFSVGTINHKPIIFELNNLLKITEDNIEYLKRICTTLGINNELSTDVIMISVYDNYIEENINE